MNRGRRSGWGLVAGSLVAMAGLLLAGCGDRSSSNPRAPERIAFAILSAQGQASAAPLWQPLLDDLSQTIGVPVEPRFTADYTELLGELERGQVQAAWLSPGPAVQAVDAGSAEVVARTVNADGEASYRSTLIVRRGAGITLQDVLACGARYSFGSGDAQSTSGTLAPQVFLFNPRNIRPEGCFKSVRTANHERNAFEVATGVLDVATSNTATSAALERQNPVLAAQIETLWSSPPIPESGILVRPDIDPVVKEKIRTFFLAYGRGDSSRAARQRQVLAALNYSRFIAADDDYLDPVRELAADQALTSARASGDQAAAARAEAALKALRAKREIQP